MDGLFTVIVFLVIGALSIISKAQEKRKIEERKKRQKPDAPLPDATRRVLYGPENPQTARPKGAPPAIPEAPKRTEAAPKPAVQEILESLLGVELDEGEWQPVEPAPRRELPPKTQHAPQHEGHIQRPDNVREASREQREHTGADYTRQAPPPVSRERSEKSRRQRGKAQPPRRQRQSRPRQEPAPAKSSAAIFYGLDDVRKAIVFAEVLGPPKAFKEDSDLWH